MNCAHRDADLLMLAHDELDRLQTFRIRAHLLICPSCRTRLRRFEALAGVLAANYRNPVLGVRPLRRVPARAWAGFGLLAALLTLLGWLASSNAAAGQAAAVPPPAPTVACPPHACPSPQSPKVALSSNFGPRHCDR